MKRIIQILILFVIIFWADRVQAPISAIPDVSTLPQTTTLLAVGDILLSRHVGTKIDAANNINLPFEDTAKLLNSADIAFGNLECPLSESNVPIREGIVFRCLTKYVPGLEYAGFDVLSTANNHAMDQGLDNLEFTIDYFRSKNILPVGTYQKPALNNSMELFNGTVERDGIKFGFLAYSYTAFNDGGRSTHPQIATLNIEQMKKDIAELKNASDIIIVSMHAGTEYTRKPNQEQIDFAHAAIDAGADVVLGHHPHWIQTIEIYSPPREEGMGEVAESRKGIIFYSLGNFVFDQMWSQETREGLMVKLNFQAQELKSAELIPVLIDNYCCPRLATEAEKVNILSKIGAAEALVDFSAN